MKLLKEKDIGNFVLIGGVETEPYPSSDDRISRIAESAYYKAEARGYIPGHEIQDWLEAEAEVAN